MATRQWESTTMKMKAAVMVPAIVSAGLPATGARFSFPHAAHEKTIRGSYRGSCVPKRDTPRFIALYQRGKLADGAVLRQVPRPHA